MDPNFFHVFHEDSKDSDSGRDDLSLLVKHRAIVCFFMSQSIFYQK